MKYIGLVLIILTISVIKADLPVHCLKDQIVGKWTLMKTAPILVGDGQLKCGHSQPDDERTSYKALENEFSSNEELEITLDQSDMVTTTNKDLRGSWTMIYDEGFEIEYDEVKYFAFSKYFHGNEGVQSQCDETLVGWYNNVKSGERGCYKAQKTEKVAATHNVKQDKVVQPKAEAQQEQPTKQELKGKPLPQQDSTAKSTYTANFDADYQVDQKSIDQADNLAAPNFYEEPEPMFSTSGFIFAQELQLEDDDEEYLPLHKDSREHERIVSRLNLVQTSWTAKVPEDFKDLTVGQMNKRAGRRNQRSFLQVKSESQGNKGGDDQFKHFSRENLADLPKQLDRSELIRDPIQQHDCGSCYALATMEMIESRIKLKYNDPIRLSAQESLDCNYYNQGCDGGYGFLVSKYYTENELVDEECYPYLSANGRCNDKVQKCENKIYLGGAYGKSSEREMMEEIQKNGPIVVSFEPGMDFMYYSSGVYHSVDAQKWIKNGENLPEWEKVDHSVLAYGWGETNDGEKYWLVQNSWGKNWGDSGRFKIRRGTDESHIESMGEAADPLQINASSAASFIQQDSSSSRTFLKKNNK